MTRRALDAAGILDPDLREAYEQARRLHATHGRSYYLATRLLPPAKRAHVHALYGFARHADELVDDVDRPDPTGLVEFSARFLDDFDRGDSDVPVCLAVIHTARTWTIPRATFEAFLASMAMDLTVTGYPTYAELERYMHGSAAVIGLQMLPILEPLHPDAAWHAQRLGEAFQLSNFIRDVGEDWRRGRVYLPEEDLDRFGVTRADLAPGPARPHVVALLRHEVGRARELYAMAEPGIDLVHPSSRPCLRTAFTLYRGILDAVEAADYQVLDRRVAVPLARRARVALGALVSARLTRLEPPPPPHPPRGRLHHE